jgi:hypothetical protein
MFVIEEFLLELGEGRKGKENERKSTISKYIASVQVG